MSRRNREPDTLEAQQERAAEMRRRELQDFKDILATQAGRRFLVRLVERTGVFKVSFDNSGSITARNEGMRLVGLTYWRDLEEIDGMPIYQQALRESQRLAES